jgi:hypothetical protein
MKIGFVTIQEADNFLSAWIDSDKWIFSGKFPSIDGTGKITTPLDTIVGTGTNFLTSLNASQYIKVDDYLAKILAIIDDTTVKLDRDLEAIEGKIYKLSPSEFETESTNLKKKIQALFYAYNKLVTSPFYVLPETVSDNMKNSQILLALHFLEQKILKTAKESIHLKNQSLGIEEYSISDMTYKYKQRGSTEKINFFPQDVQDMLTHYKTTNQFIHLGRASSPITWQTIPIEAYTKWMQII